MVDLRKILSQRPQLFDRRNMAIKASSRHIHCISVGQSVAEDQSYNAVELLYLGNNKIKSLRWARTFSSLVVLSLVNNLVATFGQVSHLRFCTQLRSLGLSGNPIAQLPNYRANTVVRVPQITQLDSVAVEDKTSCEGVVNEEKMAMAMLLESCCNVRMVAHVRKVFDLHDELCAVVLQYPSISAHHATFKSANKTKRGSTKLKILLKHVGYPELLPERELSRMKQELLCAVSQEARSQLLARGYTTKTVVLSKAPVSVWRKSYSTVEQNLREQLARLLGSCTRRRSQENHSHLRKLVVVYALNNWAQQALASRSRVLSPMNSSNKMKKKPRRGLRNKDNNSIVKATTSSEQLLKTATPLRLNRRGCD